MFVKNLRWVCSRSGGKKKQKMEKWREENKRQTKGSYPLKVNKQTTEKIHCSMFLMVDVALIYVAMWRNEEWSTKSQTFRQLVII